MGSENLGSQNTGEFQVVSNEAAQAAGAEPNSREQQLRYRDTRLDEELEAPPTEFDLSAFIKVAKPKKKGAKQAPKSPERPEEPPTESATASCPVCGAFEGDEAAVAHHVGTHFV